jgi:hypothetical protein
LKLQPDVLHAFSYNNFANATLPENLKQRFANHFYSKRSGEIQYMLKPYFTDGDDIGADHASVYSYDAHIPIVFFGHGIKPATIFREVYMTDIAPTICALLKIENPSGCVGKVLEEVLR